MTVNYEDLYIIRMPLDQTLQLTQKVLWMMGSTISQVNGEQGIIKGKMGLTFRSWGEEISVRVIVIENGCQVNVKSQSSLWTTIFDWGKNAENVMRFEQGLKIFSN
ncbi:MAG: hypothetical protein IPP66_04895 [Anaerolineales bacterium]|nr:hypothetical protein [Anaerolineales bacterium]